MREGAVALAEEAQHRHHPVDGRDENARGLAAARGEGLAERQEVNQHVEDGAGVAADMAAIREDLPDKLEVEPARQSGKACIFNSSNEAKKDWGLRVRALAAEVSHGDPIGQPPEVKVESSYHVPGELAPNEGRVATFGFDARGERVETFEAFADRYDLLP